MSDMEDKVERPLNKRIEHHDCCAKCMWYQNDEDENNEPFWLCLRDMDDDGVVIVTRYHRDNPSLPYFMVCDLFEP